MISHDALEMGTADRRDRAADPRRLDPDAVLRLRETSAGKSADGNADLRSRWRRGGARAGERELNQATVPGERAARGRRGVLKTAGLLLEKPPAATTSRHALLHEDAGRDRASSRSRRWLQTHRAGRDQAAGRDRGRPGLVLVEAEAVCFVRGGPRIRRQRSSVRVLAGEESRAMLSCTRIRRTKVCAGDGRPMVWAGREAEVWLGVGSATRPVVLGRPT